jgi:hypothetical protein
MKNDCDTLVANYVSVPAWIDQDITLGEVENVYNHGCESGAYMKAVTYSDALSVMHKHGDDVMDYIYNVYGDELPGDMLKIFHASSWSGLACRVLSLAVEMWADSVYGDLPEIED